MIYRFIFLISILFFLYITQIVVLSFSVPHSSTGAILQKFKYFQPNSLLLFLSQCNFTEIMKLIESQSIIVDYFDESDLAISHKSAGITPIILHLQN